jgi:hypothetical protein
MMFTKNVFKEEDSKVKEEKTSQRKGERPGFTFLKRERSDESVEWVRDHREIRLSDKGKRSEGFVAAPCADTKAVAGEFCRLRSLDARTRP